MTPLLPFGCSKAHRCGGRCRTRGAENNSRATNKGEIS
ncbi:hypothetical protein PVAP13_9NG560900 [Panicum virgatum]|uniref:Uncharacterized protein n=1 Tax=Panicum virgatum TaxID=38727 RepID=A0A8T0MY67_PANVG|nr:hypothetical protein PVAP13_9NG560900 [Panicum virgatum]